MRKAIGQRIRLIKSCRFYTTAELADVLRVSSGTIRQWCKKGLSPIDPECKPFLFRGSDAKRFLKERRNKRKCCLQADEFYCVRCRRPRKSKPSALQARPIHRTGSQSTTLRVRGECSTCGAAVNRFMAESAFFDAFPEVRCTTGEERLSGGRSPLVNRHIEEEETNE